MDKTLNVLQQFCSQWQSKLKLGKTYNTPLSIGFADEEFELLTCTEHNIKGTGSISHGYDHDNHDETKGACLIQPKKCDLCGGKVHFFSEKCLCESVSFKYVNDSRWGIDTKAHFDYKVKNYHLWVLYPENYSYDCKIFKLKQYIIHGENIAFNDTLKVQLEKGSTNSKNFIPFGSDFYASNPKETSSFTITFDDIFDVVVTRNEVEEVVYDKDIIKKMSKIMNLSFVNDKDTYHYEELLPHINVREKKTTHGKERGSTSRRSQ